MKVIFSICIIISSVILKAQHLTLDELLSISNRKITPTTDMLINKKWRLLKTNKNMSEDKSYMYNETANWSYLNSSGTTIAKIEYVKELYSGKDPLNYGKYFVDVHCDFLSLEYYNKLSESIKLKKWKLAQNGNIGESENQDGTVYKSYESDKYLVALAVSIVKGQQIYFIHIHNKIGVDE